MSMAPVESMADFCEFSVIKFIYRAVFTPVCSAIRPFAVQTAPGLPLTSFLPRHTIKHTFNDRAPVCVHCFHARRPGFSITKYPRSVAASANAFAAGTAIKL